MVLLFLNQLYFVSIYLEEGTQYLSDVFLTFSWNGRTNQKLKSWSKQTHWHHCQWGKHKISYFQTWPNEQCQNLSKKKKTFQFSLGYLLLGFQLKTLEDFFMELFNYLYFTCQKKNKSYKYWMICLFSLPLLLGWHWLHNIQQKHELWPALLL